MLSFHRYGYMNVEFVCAFFSTLQYTDFHWSPLLFRRMLNGGRAKPESNMRRKTGSRVARVAKRYVCMHACVCKRSGVTSFVVNTPTKWRPEPDVTPETVRNRLLSWYLTSPFNISKCSTLPEISEKVVWTWFNGATWLASVTQFRRSDSAPRGDVTRRPAAGAGRSGSGVRRRADGPDWWVSVTGRLLAPDAGCLKLTGPGQSLADGGGFRFDVFWIRDGDCRWIVNTIVYVKLWEAVAR